MKNYEEFGLPLTDMKLHKKWRSNRARKLYFKEPTLDLCRMRNSDQGSSLEELEEESKFFPPGFKVPIIHHTEFEEPVLLHLESGEPILVQKVGGRRKARIDFDEQYQRLCNLLPLNQDPNKVKTEHLVFFSCLSKDYCSCPIKSILWTYFDQLGLSIFDTDVCGSDFGGCLHICEASCTAGDSTG